MENSNNAVRIQICQKCYEHLQIEKHDESQFHTNYEELRTILKYQGLKVYRNKPFNYLSKVNIQKNQNLYIDQNSRKIVRFPKIGAFQVVFQGFLIYSKKNSISLTKIPSMRTIAHIILDIRKRLKNEQNLESLTAFRNIQFEWKEAETIKISLLEYILIKSEKNQLQIQQIKWELNKLVKSQKKNWNLILAHKQQIFPYSFFKSKQKFSKIKTIYNTQKRSIKINSKYKKSQDNIKIIEKNNFEKLSQMQHSQNITQFNYKGHKLNNTSEVKIKTKINNHLLNLSKIKTQEITKNNAINSLQRLVSIKNNKNLISIQNLSKKLINNIKRPMTSVPRTNKQNYQIQLKNKKPLSEQLQNHSNLKQKIKRSQSDESKLNGLEHIQKEKQNQQLTNYVRKNIQSARLTRRVNHSAFYSNFMSKQPDIMTRTKKRLTNQKSTLHQRTFSNISNGKETCHKCINRQKLFDQHYNRTKSAKSSRSQKNTIIIQNQFKENQFQNKQTNDILQKMTNMGDMTNKPELRQKNKISLIQHNLFQQITTFKNYNASEIKQNIKQQKNSQKQESMSIICQNCPLESAQINVLSPIICQNNFGQQNKNSLGHTQLQLYSQLSLSLESSALIRNYNDVLYKNIRKFLTYQKALIRKYLCYKLSETQLFDQHIKMQNYLKLQQLANMNLQKQKFFKTHLIKSLRNIFKFDQIKLFPSKIEPISQNIQFNLAKSKSLLPEVANFLIKTNQTLITRLFQNHNCLNFHGFYCVWLYSNQNIFEQVIINDQFPFSFYQNSENFNLIAQKYIWYMVLEKSIAKMLGSYQNLAQCSYSQLMKMLTGCQIVQIYNLRPQKLQKFLSQKLLNNKKSYVFAIRDNNYQKIIERIKGISQNYNNAKLSLIHLQTNSNLRLSSINLQDFCKQFKSICLIFLDSSFYFNQIKLQQRLKTKRLNNKQKSYEMICKSKKCLTYISIGNNFNNLKVKLILFQQVFKTDPHYQKIKQDQQKIEQIYQKQIQPEYKYNGQISKSGNFFFQINIKKGKNVLILQNLENQGSLENLAISLYSQKQILIQPIMQIKTLKKYLNFFDKSIKQSIKQNNQKSELKKNKILYKKQNQEKMLSNRCSLQKQKNSLKKVLKKQLLKNLRSLNNKYVEDDVTQNIKFE